MKLVTWNVNSLNMRLPRVLEFFEEHAPDVVLMQETKCEAAAFPTDELAQTGYDAVHHSAGRWAGVAIVARQELELEAPMPGLPGELQVDEARWIEATVGGMRLASTYVPNGRAIDTPTFEEKLAFLDAAAERASQLRAGDLPFVIAGDFNVAPADLDVYDPEAFIGSTHVTREERSRIEAIIEAGGLVDAYRHLHPDEVHYTWWDYRQVISRRSHTAVMPTNPSLCSVCAVQVNEPGAEHSLHLWAIEPAWLREAMRLSLKSRMEAGDIRWSTVRSEGAYLRRFSQFLQERGIEDRALGADVHEARSVLLDFRSTLQSDLVTRGPNVGKKRSSESVRTGLHTVCGMYRWIAHNPREAQAGLDDPRWSRVGCECATLLRRGEWPREKKSRDRVREELVPPEVLTQIVRNVHVMGDPAEEGGLGDRQAERLLLLIAKLGRRINEYLKIRFDCVAPIVGMPTRSTKRPEEFEAPAGRLFYNQAKIDGAPQSMLIDAETVAVIRAQQQYVRDFYASRGLIEVDPQFLFIPVGHAQLSGDRAYSATTLHRRMTAFAEAIDVKDGEGRRFRLSKVHRFRHTVAPRSR